MEGLERVFSETLAIATRLGTPVVFLFLIGYMLRLWHLWVKSEERKDERR